MILDEDSRNEIFQVSIHRAHELALVFDETGLIVYANQTAEDKLEYGLDMLSSYIWEVFPSVFSKTGDGFASECDFDGTDRQLDAYRKNRTCFPVNARLLKGTGVVPFYCCMAFDASESNMLWKQVTQMKQEVGSADQMKSEFVASVTHELRTPVNGILGNARELAGLENDPEKSRLLSLIQRGCADMNAIINNILDFSKLESGKFLLEKRSFDFRSMMDYVASNHRNKITEKGLEFTMTISPEIPESVIGDELRIVQILNNLLSNACKFTSVGGIILEVVKTAQIGDRIELFFLVIDTGIGIDKADQDKLFRSFTQVDASISRRYGGTGLGLNISKQLVEMMDGNIHVESEKGKGSMFSFHIWVEVPDDLIKEAPAKAEIPKTAPVPEDAHPLIQSLLDVKDNSRIWEYGSEENLEEINKSMSKLILCVEMENWEKAETFANTIKQLTEEAPHEIKSAALRLKMAVQKADYDKASEAHRRMQELTKPEEKGK